MKKGILTLLLSAAAIMIISEGIILSQQAVTGIKVGSKVPEFALVDQNGKMFDLKNVLGSQNLIIYFYVKDETPGCTTEACTFRDEYEVFRKAQAMIIGISAQSVESHKNFTEKYKLPFTLLSDKENKVRKMFGVRTDEKGSIPGRVTFVVDRKGKIVYIFDSQTQPVKHVSEAMRILKEMK